MAEVNSAKERIQALQAKEADAWTTIEGEISEMRASNDSIIALLDQIKARLDNALNSGNITERIIALKQFMDEEQQRIADAVIRNTPAENPPDEEEEEEEGEEGEDDDQELIGSNDPTREPSNGNPVHGTDDADPR